MHLFRATLPDHFGIDWTIQWQPLCELKQPVAIEPQFLLASRLRPPDHRAGWTPANVGRTIRNLHSSLII